MSKLLITMLAVGLIGCAQKPQTKVLMRIVDPYSGVVYQLTDARCPRSGVYYFAFAYQDTLQGCYRIEEAQQKIYFISSIDWRTEVSYTFAQLIQSKRDFYISEGNALRSVTPSYGAPTPSQPNAVQSNPRMQTQCFTNGFGTITCN